MHLQCSGELAFALQQKYNKLLASFYVISGNVTGITTYLQCDISDMPALNGTCKIKLSWAYSSVFHTRQTMTMIYLRESLITLGTSSPHQPIYTDTDVILLITFLQWWMIFLEVSLPISILTWVYKYRQRAQFRLMRRG